LCRDDVDPLLSFLLATGDRDDDVDVFNFKLLVAAVIISADAQNVSRAAGGRLQRRAAKIFSLRPLHDHDLLLLIFLIYIYHTTIPYTIQYHPTVYMPSSIQQ
jgi:hypothetical protein